MDFIFHSGTWDSEITFTIVDPLNDTLFSGAAPSDLDNLLHTSTSSCAPQSGNCSGVGNVFSSNITTNSADISWTPGIMIRCGIWNTACQILIRRGYSTNKSTKCIYYNKFIANKYFL